MEDKINSMAWEFRKSAGFQNLKATGVQDVWKPPSRGHFQPKVLHDCVIPWSRGVVTGRGAQGRAGGSGVLQEPVFIHSHSGSNQSPSDEQSQAVQVWPPREVGDEEWLGIPIWRPGDSSRISPWRILTLLEPPLSWSLTRSGLVWVLLPSWASTWQMEKATWWRGGLWEEVLFCVLR